MKWNITTKTSHGEKIFRFNDDDNHMGFTLSYDSSEPKKWFIRDMFVRDNDAVAIPLGILQAAEKHAKENGAEFLYSFSFWGSEHDFFMQHGFIDRDEGDNFGVWMKKEL